MLKTKEELESNSKRENLKNDSMSIQLRKLKEEVKNEEIISLIEKIYSNSSNENIDIYNDNNKNKINGKSTLNKYLSMFFESDYKNFFINKDENDGFYKINS